MTKKRLGIVAVVPFWSQASNLNADSNYSFLRLVLPRMVEKTKDTIFLMFFPDPTYGKGDWKYTNDGLQSDRIKFIPWPYDTQMATGIANFDATRWAKIDENYAPSCAQCNNIS